MWDGHFVNSFFFGCKFNDFLNFFGGETNRFDDNWEKKIQKLFFIELEGSFDTSVMFKKKANQQITKKPKKFFKRKKIGKF